MRTKTDVYTTVETIAFAIHGLGCVVAFGYVAYGLLDFSNAGSSLLSLFFTLLFGLLITLGASVILAPVSFILAVMLTGICRIALPKH